MNHTDIVRYLIKAGADLQVCDMERHTAMDLSMRKVTTNDEFANGILRPITGVKITGEGKNAVWDMEAIRKRELKEAKKERERARRAKLRGKYSKKAIGANLQKTQLFQEMRSMRNWDYGKELLFKQKLKHEKQEASQTLGRVILKDDLSEAKSILTENPGINLPDPNDSDRSPLTYASMFASPDTVKWMVHDVGVLPREQDVQAAHHCKKSKNVDVLKDWSSELQEQTQKAEEQVLKRFEEATTLRSKEAAAKQGLEFLRGLLREGRVRNGTRHKRRLVRSLDALAECPLGPAGPRARTCCAGFAARCVGRASRRHIVGLWWLHGAKKTVLSTLRKQGGGEVLLLKPAGVRQAATTCSSGLICTHENFSTWSRLQRNGWGDTETSYRSTDWGLQV